MDGVLTATAKLHAAAWKQTFDAFLRQRAEVRKETFVPFDIGKDYREYIDGKPRFDGVQSFIASRGIELLYGGPSDPPNAETICGLGNKKNELVNEIMEREGVEAYPGSVKAFATCGIADARQRWFLQARTVRTFSRRRESNRLLMFALTVRPRQI
jgi:beta-phosphoglucomutase-like phosphatase (HAD superfamily)